MINLSPETVANIALLASQGLVVRLLPDGSIEARAGEDTRSPGARRTASYRQRKASQSVTDHHKTSQNVTCDAEPSPSSPLSTPLPPTPPPTLSPAPARKEPDFSLQTEPEKPAKRFTPPPIEDWKAYGSTLAPPLPALESENAWNFYASKGWKVGNQPMKDWKAALRTCHGRWVQDGKHTSPTTRHASYPHNRPPGRSDTANKPGRYS
ncbi:hypothetical protein [Prosthecobacter sp. SYSU 5D2]|uniref:hypothetical protein n=1 Tax=Prosthecobacter sp. SYSU 5D2 TaxID=3134134 RepID=UPI0031FE9B92